MCVSGFGLESFSWLSILRWPAQDVCSANLIESGDTSIGRGAKRELEELHKFRPLDTVHEWINSNLFGHASCVGSAAG
jgi:hypothetical protein